LSGQVGDIPLLDSSDTATQTRQTLAKIEKLLAEAGSSKDHILDTQIWVKNITTDFAPMNEVWNEWVGPESKKKVRKGREKNRDAPQDSNHKT
jgi:enamine deaminase RidA (YjgF/YER057c/UK114 family)